MARWDKFAEGMAGGLGQGLKLGKQVKANVAEKRNKAIDAEIGSLMEQGVTGNLQKEHSAGTVADWQAKTDNVDAATATADDLHELPMAVRYKMDGENNIKRVQDLLYKRHGGFTPEYTRALADFTAQLSDEQQNLMAQAKNALNAGDQDAAAEMLTRAYAMYPDGDGIQISRKGDELYGILFDGKTMKAAGSAPINAETIDMAAMQMKDPTAFQAFMLQKAKNDREEAAEERAADLHPEQKKGLQLRNQMDSIKLDMAELDRLIAFEDDIGARARMRLDMDKKRQEIQKLESDAFQAEAMGLYYLGKKDGYGARFPGGLKASEYTTLVKDVRQNIEGRVESKVTTPNYLYDTLYKDHSNVVYAATIAGLEEALSNGQAYNPAELVDAAELAAAQTLGIDLRAAKAAWEQEQREAAE